MMKPYLTILTTILLIFEVANTASLTKQVTVFDLIAEAQDQLNQLRSIVLGQISEAQNDFSQYYSDMSAYSHNVMSLGELSIDQVYATVSEELTQIKDLAAAQNKDISRCTGGREQMIHRLPDELKARLDTCITDQNREAAQVLDDSTYLVDVSMTKVHQFENDLKTCGDSILCVSPLVTQIELSMVTIPEEIKGQVVKAAEMISDLKILVGQCRDVNVADFTGYVTDLISQIATCVNGILGQSRFR